MSQNKMSVPTEREDYYVKFDYQANSIGVLSADSVLIAKMDLQPKTGIGSYRIGKNSLGV